MRGLIFLIQFSRRPNLIISKKMYTIVYVGQSDWQSKCNKHIHPLLPLATPPRIFQILHHSYPTTRKCSHAFYIFYCAPETAIFDRNSVNGRFYRFSRNGSKRDRESIYYYRNGNKIELLKVTQYVFGLAMCNYLNAFSLSNYDKRDVLWEEMEPFRGKSLSPKILPRIIV